jgi:hypothetical protein
MNEQVPIEILRHILQCTFSLLSQCVLKKQQPRAYTLFARKQSRLSVLFAAYGMILSSQILRFGLKFLSFIWSWMERCITQYHHPILYPVGSKDPDLSLDVRLFIPLSLASLQGDPDKVEDLEEDNDGPRYFRELLPILFNHAHRWRYLMLSSALDIFTEYSFPSLLERAHQLENLDLDFLTSVVAFSSLPLALDKLSGSLRRLTPHPPLSDDFRTWALDSLYNQIPPLTLSRLTSLTISDQLHFPTVLSMMRHCRALTFIHVHTILMFQQWSYRSLGIHIHFSNTSGYRT